MMATPRTTTMKIAVFSTRAYDRQFMAEIAAKSSHQLTHPSDEVRRAYQLERSRGKIGGPKMKHAVSATAECVRIGRLNERCDSWIVQM